MNKRDITFFQVGRGNCCLMKVDDTYIVFDLHGTKDKTSFELIAPLLPKKNGKISLDVLCISHGDEDHCGGFTDFKKEIDAGNLVIGSIWHPNYDRTKVEDVEDLPKDYLALHEEIMRRRNCKDRHYGNIEVPLTAWDDERKAFEGLTIPDDFHLRVLSPYVKDDGDADWDVNDISLVINVDISELPILFTGDSGSEIWQERIIPYTLSQDDKKNWAKTNILIASHHGSFTFFGKNRDEVRDADPYPDNYDSLDFIEPYSLLVSADSRFPTSQDSSGDQPPHYAAWKWFHKWFQDNRNISEDDKHPACFRYTADGHIRLEYENGKWKWVNDWSPDDNGSGTGKGAIGFVYHGRETKRDEGHYA